MSGVDPEGSRGVRFGCTPGVEDRPGRPSRNLRYVRSISGRMISTLEAEARGRSPSGIGPGLLGLPPRAWLPYSGRMDATQIRPGRSGSPTFRMALAEVAIEDLARELGASGEVLAVALRSHRRSRAQFEAMCPTDATVRHYGGLLLRGTALGRLAWQVGVRVPAALEVGPGGVGAN